MKTTTKLDKNKRSCDGCTVCCDGWATGDAHGHRFYPGRRCFFVGVDGCTIYQDRPHQPCVAFNCEWLKNENIPEWMKPNQVNVLIAAETRDGISYITVKEAGKRLDVSVLSWLINAQQSGILPNIRYELDGGWNFIGTPEFIGLMAGTPVSTNRPIPRKQL